MSEVRPSHTIGAYVPMVDGPEKVSGRAKYTADFIAPGMLAGRIYRSPYSHGEILDVDVSAALRLPGVMAIVTGTDCDKTFGVLPVARSEHPLARDKVRYRGEPVAAVAAVAAGFCSSEADDFPQIVQEQQVIGHRIDAPAPVEREFDNACHLGSKYQYLALHTNRMKQKIAQ